MCKRTGDKQCYKWKQCLVYSSQAVEPLLLLDLKSWMSLC